MAADSDDTTSRIRARQTFEGLRTAMLDAAAAFSHDAAVVSQFLTALDGESNITALAAAYPISQERVRLASALENYETSRRDARIELWRVMLDEGCSIGEIGRIFGLSRQLVSRQLKDSQQV
jgi:hypothetical protein